MRVHVLSGDGEQDLGYGEYVGKVPVVCLYSESEGRILSLHEPTNIPDEIPDGFEIKELPENPKIVLDSGDVVYGCQVWFEPA